MFQRILEVIRQRRKNAAYKFALRWFDQKRIILDLGCGCGNFLKHIGDRGIGLDWNAESLREAEKVCTKVVYADVRNIPLDSSSVDGVYCSHLIEHFSPEDVHKILMEIDRVLMSGGIIVLSTPVLWQGFYNDLSHVRPYHPNVIFHYLLKRTQQHTFCPIKGTYEVIRLKWRYVPLHCRVSVFNLLGDILNLWGFPWLKHSAYTLVLRKTR